ncbi:uncharacterized protein LOC131428677 [Malaya genurostris]|uniref:uncharacterized protein LOC131428677 n=1 Tax=Malaya genurostris TaxID=325434 RepID=UPI0026F3FE41|nr:uncharacterized protein LOC131428677 [Malaya genurostris]
MIKYFPVGDSLHLIDLGIMKKLLLGWRDGKFGSLNTQWSANVVTGLSESMLLMHFLEHFKDFYGVDYMSSNVHNLSNLVDDVRRFGTLPGFSAYPFENKI